MTDRLVLLVGLDFGRTPYYNSGGGKDRWPIGSFIVMERNAGYTKEVFGEINGGHNTFPLTPVALQRDDLGGVILRPAHVHKPLRN